jgi:hypothetical protein
MLEFSLFKCIFGFLRRLTINFFYLKAISLKQNFSYPLYVPFGRPKVNFRRL